LHSCKMTRSPLETMNYRDQENFLRGSRIWGAVVCLAFLAAAIAVRLTARGRWTAGETIFFPLIALAIGVLIYYTSDYLHLSVAPERKRLWEIKIRWRIVAAVLVPGLALAHGNSGRLFTLFAVAWLAATNWLARKRLPAEFLPAF